MINEKKNSQQKTLSFYYQCTECGSEYEITPEIMVCPICSRKQKNYEPLRGILSVEIAGELPDEFEILDILPVEKKYFPDIPVGDTPLWEPKNIRDELGFTNLFLKDDTLNPTGSLKDRASYLVAGFVRKHNINNIAVASTGNAASSMAGVGASAGISVTIFVPKNAPQAKLIQSLQYGARVIPVDGNYDYAFDISLEYSRITGALSRNTAYNPLTIEGKKTVSLEIFKQLGKAPDFIFVPVGDGVILAGVYKGFLDLKKLGYITDIPIVYGVQSQGSSAICDYFHTGKFTKSYSAETIADSIC
ncbi:pyridoxal-5'-phosphate-dependent protein subunit beta, partial [bacterium]